MKCQVVALPSSWWCNGCVSVVCHLVWMMTFQSCVPGEINVKTLQKMSKQGCACMVNARKSWMLHPWIPPCWGWMAAGDLWLCSGTRWINWLCPLQGQGWEEMSFSGLLPSPTCVLLSLLPSSHTPKEEQCCISVVPVCVGLIALAWSFLTEKGCDKCK